MKKSRIIALLTAAAMIMSIVPAFAADMSSASYIVSDDGTVLERVGDNLIPNSGFEEGLTGIAGSPEYYALSDAYAYSGSYSLQALQSIKAENSLSAVISVSNPSDSYYLSFRYLNTDEAARRPRVTFAFTDSLALPPADEDFIDETNSWVAAGTASNDRDMAYSKGEWVQYSTIINGNGNAAECSKVLLQIYGLTKEKSYVDDIEIYRLSESAEYNAVFSAALSEWESNSVPSGPLAGIGKLELPREIKSASGVSVKWSSSSELIDAETGDYASGASASLAILTARVYIDGLYDEIYKEYEYAYVVKSMFDPYTELVNKEFDSFGSSVKGNLSFKTSMTVDGYYPAEISWECSDPNVIASDGTFTAPETTKYVNLSAVITCGEDSHTVSRRIKALGGNIISDGLVMYYDFETEISKNTVEDASGKGNAAASTGITIEDGCAYFDGVSSTLTLPSNYGSYLTGSYSVSMWVKLDKTIASSAGMYRFFDFGGDTYNSQFLRYIPSTGQLSFMDRGKAANGGDWALSTTLTGIADTWKLITFMYDFSASPATARVYIDGEYFDSASAAQLTRSISEIAGTSSMTGYIGRTQWYNADNPDYKGYMDDIRVYNRVLTEDEIHTLYSETRPTVTANVTVKYVDTEGNPLFDNAGNLLAPDVVVQYDVDTTYDVPASLRSAFSFSDGSFRYLYKYVASKSEDSVYVTTSGENVCTLVYELTKSLKGTNLIENGSFENGTVGWTNRLGTDIVGATVEYDASIGANAMNIQTMGKDSTQSLGTIWKVESGKSYTLSFDVGGAKPGESNYGYNRISDSYNYVDGHYENAGNDLVKFGEEMADGAWTHFTKTFVAQTDTVYIQSSWATGTMKFANFVLEENTSGGDTPEEPGDETSVPIIIKYQDSEGNTIKDDVVVKVAKGTQTYTAPSSVTALEDKTEGLFIYKYVYLQEESTSSIGVSVLYDNVVTLVYDVIKASKTSNAMVDGGFDNGSGSFSWGDWQSPETGEYFRNNCSDWFYVVNRDTNSATRYNAASLPKANDYALGTLWNDGITGLCSMANFVKVKAGKTYIVSYDYKHNTAGTDASYISTSFVENNDDLAANPEGYNIPKNVSTQWQTNSFMITAPTDGYIYFHFSYLGSGGSTKPGENNGGGPHWYFDNFEVLEVITFENKMTYSNGYAEILAEDGTTGYLVQAIYDEEGALASVKVSEELTLNQETPVRIAAAKGAKLILVKDLATLEPICPAITAE